MAKAEQIKALIKSHYDYNYTRFDTLSLQLAAHEATLGHNALALELKKIVESSKKIEYIILRIQKISNFIVTIQ